MSMLISRRLQPRYNLANDAGTWQFKLPKVGLMSGITMVVEFTNGATSCKDEDVYDAIDKVEVIADGSRVIYSLTGQQARLWTHVHLRARPPYVRDEQASAVQRAHIYIPFGLHKYDTQHYLDLSRFSDVEIRLTYSPTIAATGFTTATGYVTVFGDFWYGGAPGPDDGYLKHSEQYYFTSLASGDTLYDLPIGNDLIGLGLYVYESGIDPHANIDAVELDIDHGSWSPVVGLFEDLAAMYTRELMIDPHEWGTVFKSDTDTIETRTGSVAMAAVEPVQVITTPGTTDRNVVIVESTAGGLVTLGSFAIDAATTAADAANTTDFGIMWSALPKYGLGNFLVVPFGLGGVNFALPTKQYGNVRVTMTNGNAGAEVRLSSLELVRR